MEFNNLFLYIFVGLGGILFLVTTALFFVSHRAHKVTKSLLAIMTQPERAKVQDASRVLQTIMAGELEKITKCFTTIHDSLNAQITQAEKLQQELRCRNDALVALAEDAVAKTSQTSGRLENTVSGLQNIVESSAWNDVQNTTDGFLNTVSQVLENINIATTDSTEKLSHLEEQMAKWNENNKILQEELQKSFDTNTIQFQTLSDESEKMKSKISELADTTANTFANVKSVAQNYEDTMENNTKILSSYLVKLDKFGTQSKKQLTGQMNTLTNTANVVGAQVLLAEASIDNHIRKLTNAVETLMASANETENSVKNISAELTGLTNHFGKEIKEYSGNVVEELKHASGIANATFVNTKEATSHFSESVKDMAARVRESLLDMDKTHANLSAQAQVLIEMSDKTTTELKPLSELIAEYHKALPDLNQTSVTTAENLSKIIAQLETKIEQMKSVIAESTEAVIESSSKLGALTSQSSKQIKDLMTDYNKAVDTMEVLNKQITVARAAAPMDAIKTAPETFARVSSRDFLTHSDSAFNKMYEQAMDLTRTMGAEIPDMVWKKYHDGDKTIFAKWLTKVLKAANKKQIRELIKTDTVFRSQATQFVRSFDNVLTAAKQTDTPDKLIAALNKTELGQIYTTISPQL